MDVKFLSSCVAICTLIASQCMALTDNDKNARHFKQKYLALVNVNSLTKRKMKFGERLPYWVDKISSDLICGIQEADVTVMWSESVDKEGVFKVSAFLDEFCQPIAPLDLYPNIYLVVLVEDRNKKFWVSHSSVVLKQVENVLYLDDAGWLVDDPLTKKRTFPCEEDLSIGEDDEILCMRIHK